MSASGSTNTPISPIRQASAGLASLILLLVPAGAAAQQAGQLTPYVDSIPGTLVSFEMVPVPAGAGVAPFWISRTEVTWDAYDVFALGLDTAAQTRDADAIARPSRPYGAPDYGFGHAGYPVISVTRQAAEAYCEWLSMRTGGRYRLPTDAEWQRAAELAAAGPTDVASLAWHAGNSAGKTHRVGSRAPDALGLYDLFGNAAEWVAPTASRVVRGGSFRDPPEDVGPNARAVQRLAWNERDPQIPKSRWWLSDAPFVGFRIVREP